MFDIHNILEFGPSSVFRWLVVSTLTVLITFYISGIGWNWIWDLVYIMLVFKKSWNIIFIKYISDNVQCSTHKTNKCKLETKKVNVNLT